MAPEDRRGDGQATAPQVLVHHIGAVRIGQKTVDRCEPAFRFCLWVARPRGGSWAICADDFVDFLAGLCMIPPVLLADQDEAGPGATLIAKV